MQLTWKLSSLTLAVMAVFSTSAFAEQTLIAKENNNIQAVSDYWTPERLKNAKPLTMPSVEVGKAKEMPVEISNKDQAEFRDGKEPTFNLPIKAQQLYTPARTLDGVTPFNRGTFNAEFSSGRLVPITADVFYPYRTVGKLFFTIPGQGDFVCSASVIRPRVLATAGHCVHSGSGGVGGFYSNFKFVPAFRDGTAPYQTWDWSYVIVTSTWATGGGAVPNAADYALIEVGDKVISGTPTRIGNVTGWLGYQTLSLMPNHTHMLGYPCNFDSCQKMHQVAAQSFRGTSPNNVEYGSDMRGGSSGGPWVQNFGLLAVGQTGGLNAGTNRVVGVTSYGYVDINPKVQGASIFDSRFVSIMSTICARSPTNCT